jgi:hypothetical protein
MNMKKARLADIEVDEVSIVDKAANKRKFLFMKRDVTSEDNNEGGENLELLKQFKKNPEAIAALEGLEENLVKFDGVLKKALENPKLTAEEKEMLLEKKAEYESLKQDMEDGFEKLFLDKASTKDEDEDSEDEEDVEEEDDEEAEDESEEDTEVKAKKKPTKKSDDTDGEVDEEAEEESEEETEDTEVKKSDDESEDSDEDAEPDEEDSELLKSIEAELNKGVQLRKELAASQVVKKEETANA